MAGTGGASTRRLDPAFLPSPLPAVDFFFFFGLTPADADVDVDASPPDAAPDTSPDTPSVTVVVALTVTSSSTTPSSSGDVVRRGVPASHSLCADSEALPAAPPHTSASSSVAANHTSCRWSWGKPDMAKRYDR